MAVRHNTSIDPPDLKWLNDAFDRNSALALAFDRIAGNDKAKRSWLKQACLRFIFIYENFKTYRTRARADLDLEQKWLDKLEERAQGLVIKDPYQKGPPLRDPRYHEFAGLRQAAGIVESRIIFDRALATEAGYLSRQGTALNTALLQLIQIAGNRDADVAALAEALLNQRARRSDGNAVSMTINVKAETVRNVRRASGIVVR